MKQILIFLGIICLLAGFRITPKVENYARFFIDGKEYTYEILYGEVLKEDPFYNLYVCDQTERENERFLEMYIMYGMHGDGEYQSVDLSGDFEQLQIQAAQEKVIIIGIKLGNTHPEMEGFYYALEGFYQITQTANGCQITTVEPVRVKNEKHPDREITMELKLVTLPLHEAH
ncbi:MAG: hypothetical protein LUG98_15140 [Tannerellaceae bacterium]|nr:hypothetical protein [Tannerellaceae bacterium]